MIDDLRNKALSYHATPTPGKIGIAVTKPTLTQEDLSLCYTPGVAEPVLEIVKNPFNAYRYTNKGNLVAILTNGTAVLGLGNVGALASKPVMEGKAALFKRFAGVDAIDIEIDCHDPAQFVETVVHIAPSFGGINLEDIKAPECFFIEEALQKRLTIPVFHDDQHGTAIVIAAGLLNALEVQNKTLLNIKIVCAGAGAAGIAAVKLLHQLGVPKEHIFMVDRGGVIHTNRQDLNVYKQMFAVQTDKTTLETVLIDADVFIGVSGPNILTAKMIASMASKPIIFALSNPVPEIMPEIAYAVRKDLILATGRSDYPNQVNNALCFPYIFSGALKVRASCIHPLMQLAAVHAIKDLAKEKVPAKVYKAYNNIKQLNFGPHYLLPKLIDPRLKETVSKAVAKAAMEACVAQLN